MDGKPVGTPRGISAPTYLGWSIFSTLCCCLPLGIVAIVFSCKTDTANTMGDGTMAEEHSKTAKKLNIAALALGIILITIAIILKVVAR